MLHKFNVLSYLEYRTQAVHHATRSMLDKLDYIQIRHGCRPLSTPSQKTLPDSTNRAFADDIATIIQSLNNLTTLKSNFDLFKEVSGLDLKIKKCSLIALGSDPTSEWLKKVCKAVAQIVPAWSIFSVVLSAEYLGFIIGPKGGSAASWGTPLNKYIDQSNLIAHANTAPSTGADGSRQR